MKTIFTFIKNNFCLLLIFFNLSILKAQNLVWNGSVSTNFFTEQNWTNTSTNLPPANGTIEPNVAINNVLIINNYNQNIVANGIISLGNGSLTISNAQLIANAISGGEVVLNNLGYLDVTSVSPLLNNVSVKLNSNLAWLRTNNVKGPLFQSTLLSQLQVNGQPASYPNNIRLENYYLNGTVIRVKDNSTAPFRLYQQNNLLGTFSDFTLFNIHSGNQILNNFNQSISSFILRKGYMVTLAANTDGTGKSKNYIAIEQDLVINQLPNYLKDNVKFIRVLPWNWATKKGRTGPSTDLNTTWQYQWNNTMESSLDIEYVPMAWGAGGADSDADIDLYRSKYKSTHVLGFNEPDDCNAQSGQFNNLCNTDVAVNLYRNLMKTGMRLVSPSGREEAPFGWLKEFIDKANTLDIRMDVIAVHWYDWGSNPVNTSNATPQQIFNRFVTYLQNVYNLYGLPIWITEFNANPNRSNATNLAFMQLALPYLETLSYVERYAWYQPNSGVANYYEADGVTLSNVGIFYKNQLSNPSIPQATFSANNSLERYYNVVPQLSNNLLDNANFELGNLTSWFGSNINTLSGSDVYQGSTSGRILSGTGNIFTLAPVEPSEQYNLSFYTRWFVSPAAPISVQIRNASNDAIIFSQLMSANTNWNLVQFNFTVPSNVVAIKIYFEKGNEPGWFIDNVVLTKSAALNNSIFENKSAKIYPNPTSGIITIKTSEPITSIKVYNLQGQLILENKNLKNIEATLNIENNLKGIYLVSIETEKSTLTEKIILN